MASIVAATSPSAAVGEVVAGHHGEHGVVAGPAGRPPRPPARARRGRASSGLAGVDQAEAARPGAALAVDHERGRAVGPALGQVRAAGLLAHGDEVEVAHGPLERAGTSGPWWTFGPQPVRLAGRRSAGPPATPAWASRPRQVLRRRRRDRRRTAGPGAPGERRTGPRDGAARRRPAARRRRRPTRRRPAAATASTTSRIVTSTPFGRSDVTALSAMPHGTMWPNIARSVGDVEGEAVHRAAPAEAHADRGDLARVRRPSGSTHTPG